MSHEPLFVMYGMSAVGALCIAAWRYVQSINSNLPITFTWPEIIVLVLIGIVTTLMIWVFILEEMFCRANKGASTSDDPGK
jgi:TRAP-type C4-dicarboxylate transport system permease small subunit